MDGGGVWLKKHINLDLKEIYFSTLMSPTKRVSSGLLACLPGCQSELVHFKLMSSTGIGIWWFDVLPKHSWNDDQKKMAKMTKIKKLIKEWKWRDSHKCMRSINWQERRKEI